MSNFRKIAASASVLTALTLCPLTVQAAPANTGATAEQTLTQTSRAVYDKAVDAGETAQNWTRDAKHDAQDAWDDLGLKYKVHKIQSDVRPYGSDLRSSMAGFFRPAKKLFSWGDHYMSLPAMLLILISFVLMGFMAFSSPSSHAGEHH